MTRSLHERALPLEPLAIAAAHVFGTDPDFALPAAPPGLSARGALERAVLSVLAEGPTYVSFSGGRDSSAVLAVTTAVARREGLPDPVPITLRAPDVAETEESEWQEMVIDHLRLTDWVRVDLREELDLLGPVATAGLRRHGLLWPCTVHQRVRVLESARGGTLLTGIEGDGLFGGWRYEPLRSRLARTRPGAPSPRTFALALAPRAVRKRWLMTKRLDHLPWLTPAAEHAVRVRMAEYRGAEPARWDRRVRWWASSRYLAVALHSFGLVAAAAGARTAHPLLDRLFLSCLARDGGGAGLGGRTALMRVLFGDLLPAPVVERRTKAVFTLGAWGEHSRAFARSWDGTGVHAELVDVDRLRAMWLRPRPFAGAATLLQAAWLASAAEAAE